MGKVDLSDLGDHDVFVHGEKATTIQKIKATLQRIQEKKFSNFLNSQFQENGIDLEAWSSNDTAFTYDLISPNSQGIKKGKLKFKIVAEYLFEGEDELSLDSDDPTSDLSKFGSL